MSKATGSQADWVTIAEGARRRVLQDGEKMMMVHFHFSKGYTAPFHQHPHEQISFVLSGRVRFTVDGQAVDLEGGESIRVPSDIVHRAAALEDSLVLEIFS